MSDLRNVLFPPTEPAALDEFLKENYAEQTHERDELVHKFDLLPPRIETSADRSEYANLISKAVSFLRGGENLREATKRPFLSAGRLVDGFFNVFLGGPVVSARTKAQAELDRFVRAEEARQREEARRAAEAARIEAERVAREAAKAKRAEARAAEPPSAPASAELQHRAAELEQHAEAQRQRATAKGADLVRERTEEGALSTLVERWDFEVVEPARVPRVFCKVDDTLIRAELREAVRLGKADELRVSGVRFFVTKTAQVR